jgi:hypothetical protein
VIRCTHKYREKKMKTTNYKNYKIKECKATKRFAKSILIEEPNGDILLLIANEPKTVKQAKQYIDNIGEK